MFSLLKRITNCLFLEKPQGSLPTWCVFISSFTSQNSIWTLSHGWYHRTRWRINRSLAENHQHHFVRWILCNKLWLYTFHWLNTFTSFLLWSLICIFSGGWWYGVAVSCWLKYLRHIKTCIPVSNVASFPFQQPHFHAY